MKRVLWFCLGWALWPIAVSAQHQGHDQAPCRETGLHCATSATPAFAADGTIWLVWAAGGRVMAGHSGDLGRSFDRIATVNQEAERIDNGPDARPKIVIDRSGHLMGANAVFQENRHNGRVRDSRPANGGASFSGRIPPTDAPPT